MPLKFITHDAANFARRDPIRLKHRRHRKHFIRPSIQQQARHIRNANAASLGSTKVTLVLRDAASNLKRLRLLDGWIYTARH